MSQRWILPELRGPSISELWRRLEAYFELHEPEVLKQLNPPVDDERLRAVQKESGGGLPSDLIDSLRVHDGQVQLSGGGPIPIVPALYDPLRGLEVATWGDLSPLNHIVMSSRRYGGEVELLPMELLGSEPLLEPVLRDYLASWAIFVNPGSGDVLAIDLAPAPGGRYGQVVAIDHDPPRLTVLAPSYRAWFEELVTRYESGRYAIVADDRGNKYSVDREGLVASDNSDA